MIQAINTYYKGNYYRSRLEARWAVFFDVCKIQYQYEPEGFRFDEIMYLPDFYLPQFDCYVEVKANEIYGKEIKWVRKYINSDSTNIEWAIHPDCIKWIEFAKYKKLLLLFGKPDEYPNMLLKPSYNLFELDWRWIKSCNYFVTKHDPQIDQYEEDQVLFYNDHGEWRFWWGADSDKSFDFNIPIIAANTKRFEHQ